MQIHRLSRRLIRTGLWTVRTAPLGCAWPCSYNQHADSRKDDARLPAEPAPPDKGILLHPQHRASDRLNTQLLQHLQEPLLTFRKILDDYRRSTTDLRGNFQPATSSRSGLQRCGARPFHILARHVCLGSDTDTAILELPVRIPVIL